MPANAGDEMWVWSLSGEDPLEEDMATHSSITACIILWTEEPGWLQCTELQRVRHNWSNFVHTYVKTEFRELMRLNNQIWKWPGEGVDGVPAKERSVQDFTPGFAATGHWQYRSHFFLQWFFQSPLYLCHTLSRIKVGGIKWLAKWVPFLSKNTKQEVLASSATENGTLTPSSPNTMKYSSQ